MSEDRFGRKFDRLFVAVVTPLKENYEVDEPALRKLLQYFMQPKFTDAGGGVIINPEAGEIFYLTREEKRRNVEITLDEIKGRMPVFAGVIDNTTAGTVQVALDAKEVGADGLFVIPPIGAGDVTTCWNPVKYPEVWMDMVKEVEKAAGDMPIACHPTAPPTPQFGVGLPLEAAIRMCREIKNIVGWKMTYSYDGYRMVARALRNLDRHVGIFGAAAVCFHENLLSGQFDGTVTGSFNYAMEPMIDHITAWRREDVKEACRIWESGLAILQEYMYSDYGRLHIRYKIATWLRGLIPNPFMRPPFPKPRKDEVSTLRELLANAGLSIIEEAEISNVTKTLEL
jgi:dihydrodipicolinate synthase/N-acetylneuraminate lyase